MPGRYFHDETVYLSDLVRDSTVSKLSDILFERCEVHGPAILVPATPDVVFLRCQWDAPDADAILWVIEEHRRYLIGIIGIAALQFRDCRMIEIGLGVSAQEAEKMRGGFDGAPPGAPTDQ